MTSLDPGEEREGTETYPEPDLTLRFDDDAPPPEPQPLAELQESVPSFAGSFFLHAIVLFLLFYSLNSPLLPEIAARVLPVDLVFLGPETESPPQDRVAPVPQQRRAAPAQTLRQQPATPRPQAVARGTDLASLSPPASIAPNAREPIPEPPPPPTPTPDPLQEKLEALSNLRASDSDPRLNGGLSNFDATANGARLGSRATYGVRDYVRAQVLRRWSLDIDALRNRDIVVSLHVVLDFDGTVKEAEILDQKRFNNDVAYYRVALSARNAVLLASPLSLPNGAGEEALDMVLDFSPRNVLR